MTSALAAGQCFLLQRKCSPYTEDDLFPGAFSTREAAERARVKYVEEITAKDDHADQGYTEVDLAKDVTISSFHVEKYDLGSEPGTVWLAVGRSEGFGMAVLRSLAMRFDLNKLASLVEVVSGEEEPSFKRLSASEKGPDFVAGEFPEECSLPASMTTPSRRKHRNTRQPRLAADERPLFVPFPLNKLTTHPKPAVDIGWSGFCPTCFRFPEPWMIATTVPSEEVTEEVAEEVAEEVRNIVKTFAWRLMPGSATNPATMHARHEAHLDAVAKLLRREDLTGAHFGHPRLIDVVEPRRIAQTVCPWCFPGAFGVSCQHFVTLLRKCGRDKLAESLAPLIADFVVRAVPPAPL
jgi:hypothetical protein